MKTQPNNPTLGKRDARNSLLAAAAGALLSLAILPPSALSQASPIPGQPLPSPARLLGKPALSIAAPLSGAVLYGSVAQVSIEINSQMDRGSLRMLLNGRDISSRLTGAICSSPFCTVTASVAELDGLQAGPNVLRVDVAGKKRGRIDTRTSRFQWNQLGAVGDNTPTFYTPPSVGIVTVENGGNGNTWVTITTGQPAGVDDPVENYPALTHGGTTYPTALPSPDVQFSINCPGWTYQAMVLQRKNPTQQETATCVNSEADMESDFQTKMNRPLNASDLIIFGTTPYNFALPNLDTTGIGGTNWEKATASDPSQYPTYYIIMGVKGAAAGTAPEHSLWHSDLDSNSDTPYTWGAFLRGSLIADSNGYYNYIPGADNPFQVISGTSPSMQVGSQTYTPPSGDNGFWLLILDRNYLAPITNYAFQDSDGVQKADCPFGSGLSSCGYFFPTSGSAAPAQALAQVISSTSPQNLILLATKGCPFNSMSGASQTAVGNALENIGGMNHSVTFMNAATSGCNYALASVNDGKHIRFGSRAALSWNYFNLQGQVGAIHGNLSKDNQGFYDIAAQDQMVNQNNTFTSTVDYTFEGLASNVRTDWPVSDTTGSLAAYHDISNQLLSDDQVAIFGPNNYDLRYFYTDQTSIVSRLNSIIDARLGPNATNPVTQSNWDTATPAEFAAVRSELIGEIENAQALQGYLTGGTGNGGMRGLLNGSSGTILSDAIGVANDVGQDASVANATSTSFNAATSDWLNLFAGVLSTASAVLGPEGPAALGILSGLLWTGSAAGTPLAPTNITATSPQAIAGPSTTYDNTLAEITTFASTYTSNLLHSFDAATDAVLNDAAKLSAAGNKARDTSSGWQISSLGKGDAISDSFSAGAKMSLWNEILGQLYGLRVATEVTVTNPNQLGSKIASGQYFVCVTAYPQVPADSWSFYPNLSDGSKWDLNMLAEGPTWKVGDNGNADILVSTNVANLLTTNQQITFSGRTETGLNIPRMQLFTNGPLNYSPYAQIGAFGSCVF